MPEATIVHHMQVAMTMILLLSAPVLIIAATVGLVIGLLQAVTQIQDQTLSQSIKIIVVLLVVVFLGPLLVGPFIEHSRQLFDTFPTMTG
jgi:type III secretion protein S